ncbi:MAG: hypothetical protein ACKO6N_09455 [Myxococcota bacterium]
MLIFPLFTAADVHGKTLFRTVKVQLHLDAGNGRIHLARGHGHTFAPEWEETLLVLQRLLYTLPGQRSSARDLNAAVHFDLHIQPLGPATRLGGRSAALPLWLGWLSLLTGRALPQPFLATGVIFDDAQLQPAPRAFIQGKLQVAEALARAHLRTHEPPVHFYYPAGSALPPVHSELLILKPLNTLFEAAEQFLGVDTTPALTDGLASSAAVHSILQPGSIFHDLSRG